MLKHELMFQEFFALQDVSLKVKKGEAWGLIGTNGSGKSTLLKTISGILKPYKGTITKHGSIAPLIELGAGFDGNLTARENIFLNGMVLGHSRKFMEEHFEEIVDFANIRKFLDSPRQDLGKTSKLRQVYIQKTGGSGSPHGLRTRTPPIIVDLELTTGARHHAVSPNPISRR